MRYVYFIFGCVVVFGVMSNVGAQTLSDTPNTIFTGKNENIVIARDKQQNAVNIGDGLVEDLESLSLDNVIITGDSGQDIITIENISQSDCENIIRSTTGKKLPCNMPVETQIVLDERTQNTDTDVSQNKDEDPKKYTRSYEEYGVDSHFFYRFTGPHKVYYPLPNPFSEPKPSISDLQSDTIGLYMKRTGGVHLNYWRGYTYDEVLKSLTLASQPSDSYIYTQAMNRIILSGTDVPLPARDTQAGDIFSFRLNALLRAGRLLDAQTLLYTLPEQMRIEKYSETLAQIHMAFFDNASLCGVLNQQSEAQKKTTFWQRTHITCLALDGNADALRTAMGSVRTPLPDGMQALIDFGLDGTPIPQDTEIDINISTVHLMRAFAVGVDVPTDADMPSYYGLLQNLAVPDTQRAYYAYILFQQGAIPLSLLENVYKTVSDDILPLQSQTDVGAEPQQPSDTIDTNPIYDTPLYYQRALAYQKVHGFVDGKDSLSDNDKNAVIDDILQHLDKEPDYISRMTSIRIFAPILAKIPPYKHDKSKRIAGILYASGYYKEADAWAKQNPVSLWYEGMLSKILHSAPDTVHNVKQYMGYAGGCIDVDVNPSAWMSYMTQTRPQDAVYRINEAFLTLESFGCRIGNTYWEQLANMTPDMLMQDVIAPASMRMVQIKYDRARHALPVLFAIKPYINRVDISHMEMEKIYNILYRMGYTRLAVEIAYERNTYNPW